MDTPINSSAGETFRHEDAAVPLANQNPRAPEAQSKDDEIQEKIEHLREWGHLVSIGIMILAMFAFGIHVEEDHIKVYWKEVPAILIVFVLAEFGVTLVSAAMEVRASVKAAGKATQKAAVNAEIAVVNTAATLENLNRASSAAGNSFNNLSRMLQKLAAASEEDIWVETGRLTSYSGLKEKECWESLARYTRSWVPERFNTGSGVPVGQLFRSFVGEFGGIRRGEDEVSCVTTDSAFAEASEQWLADLLASNTGGLKVYAVTTLLPTDFALPHLWWSRNGIPYRVRTLDNFVAKVLKFCERESVEYKRVTIFNQGQAFFPNAKILHGDPDEPGSLDVADLVRSLDEWFIVDERLEHIGFEHFGSFMKNRFEGSLSVDLTPSRLVWWKILEELGLEKNKVTETNRRTHTMPRSENKDCAVFWLEDNKRHLIHLSKKALGAAINFESRDIVPALSKIKEQISSGDSLAEILRPFGYLSLRDWYVQKMHRSSAENGGALYWVARDYNERLDELSIEWDGERIPTLDLLLIENNDSGWLGAVIANLKMETPSCLVKIVTGSDALKRIYATVEYLLSNSKPWAKFPEGIEPPQPPPEIPHMFGRKCGESGEKVEKVERKRESASHVKENPSAQPGRKCQPFGGKPSAEARPSPLLRASLPAFSSSKASNVRPRSPKRRLPLR